VDADALCIFLALKQEFCWVCMGPWSDHGTSWYNCARYEEKGEKNQDAQSKSRASLERYLHVRLFLSPVSFSLPLIPFLPYLLNSTTTVSETTNSRSSSRRSFTPGRRRRWRRCRSTRACRGSRCSSSQRPSRRSASAGPCSSGPTRWHSTSRGTTRLSCSRITRGGAGRARRCFQKRELTVFLSFQ
jgi:hypothetical protein